MFDFFSEQHIVIFLLILLRISGFIVAWPLFNSIPISLKIFFSLVFSLIFFPILSQESGLPNFTMIQMVFWAITEVFIGLSLGFLSRFFFFVFQMAGSLVGVNIGISSAELFDPNHGERMDVMQQFYMLFASLFFLLINGHLLLFEALGRSFKILPIARGFLNFDVFGSFGFFFQELVEFGLKISAPILLVILFINISMSIIGRVVPQMNVLINSLPLNILAGFFLLSIVLPILFWKMEDVFEWSVMRMFQVLKSY